MELESPSSLLGSWLPSASINALVLTRYNSKALRIFWNKGFYLRVKAAWRLSSSNLIWKGRSVNSLSWKMRSAQSTSCRISLFPPHEYFASASNISWKGYCLYRDTFMLIRNLRWRLSDFFGLLHWCLALSFHVCLGGSFIHISLLLAFGKRMSWYIILSWSNILRINISLQSFF